jgi:hypothetical protein
MQTLPLRPERIRLRPGNAVRKLVDAIHGHLIRAEVRSLVIDTVSNSPSGPAISGRTSIRVMNKPAATPAGRRACSACSSAGLTGTRAPSSQNMSMSCAASWFTHLSLQHLNPLWPGRSSANHRACCLVRSDLYRTDPKNMTIEPGPRVGTRTDSARARARPPCPVGSGAGFPVALAAP